ncbi:DUF2341 domain-containing protein [Myxococcota bacterium]|nr:DUF2341 domain-containing protein [Myxococcota bacterium]
MLLISVIMGCSFDPGGLGGYDTNNTNNTNNVNNTNNANNTNNTNNVNSTCGNGVVETPEECDDQNAQPGDGCDAQCVAEQGYECQGSPSDCTPVCGDGLVLVEEACDDGNEVPSDGCTACQIDAGWECTGTPSVCIPDDWVDAAWHSRRPISIDAGTVTGDLVDFPLLILITGDSGIDGIAHEDEIIFTAEDGRTPLSHEILFFDPGGRGVAAFVKVPFIYAIHNTLIYLYYGTSSLEYRQNPADVFSNGYVAVLHLKESGAGVTDEYPDSSGNQNHGTGGGPSGAGQSIQTPSRVEGLFGYAQYFPGSTVDPTCGIHLPVIDDSAWQGLTVQIWMNPQGTEDERVFGRTWGNGSDTIVWLLGKTDRPKYRLRTVSNVVNVTNGTPFTLNTWVHYSLVWMAGGPVSVFGNGTLLNSSTVMGSTLYVDGAAPLIGNSPLYPLDPRAFHGRLQEARISSVNRSPAWLAAEYNNQVDPPSFYTLGVEQTY